MEAKLKLRSAQARASSSADVQIVQCPGEIRLAVEAPYHANGRKIKRGDKLTVGVGGKARRLTRYLRAKGKREIGVATEEQVAGFVACWIA